MHVQVMLFVTFVCKFFDFGKLIFTKEEESVNSRQAVLWLPHAPILRLPLAHSLQQKMKHDRAVFATIKTKASCAGLQGTAWFRQRDERD